jgi:hypothetical protein
MKKIRRMQHLTNITEVINEHNKRDGKPEGKTSLEIASTKCVQAQWNVEL